MGDYIFQSHWMVTEKLSAISLPRPNAQALKDFPDRATRFAVCSRLAGIAPPKKK